nr:uncharacterized protein LOC117217661 [Megalopta genalis]
MRNYTTLLLILRIISSSVNQPVENPFDFDDNSMDIHSQIYRYKKDLNSQPPFCSNTQYFDEEQKRCLDIIGGGTLLYVNKTKSCGVNVLKPHCSNPKHYYICKKNETVLAQCGEDQYFSYRLHKCVHVNHQEEVTERSHPDQQTFDSIKLPACKKSGSFPVPNDCTLFFTCETNGRRMSQTIFRCPKTMVYDAETEMCSVSAICDDTYLNASSICEPKEEGRISVLHREHEPDDEELNGFVTTDYSSIPPEFTGDIIDTTIAINNYESGITPTTDSTMVQMPLESNEFNDVDFSNSTEDILDTKSTINLSTEATEPSLQTFTWEKQLLNEEFDMAAITTENYTISHEPLQTTTVEEYSSDQNDEVTTNNIYSTSIIEVTPSNTIVGAAIPQINLLPTLEEISTSAKIDTNEPSVDFATQQGTLSLNEKELDEYTTTEFSMSEFTSTISTAEFSVPKFISTISSTELFTSPVFSNERTTSEQLHLDELPTSVEDSSAAPIESYTNSALFDQSSVSDIIAPFNDAGFLTNTDTANYVGTEPTGNMIYEPDELDDTSSDIEQIVQNFTSTLNTVSSLESALVANENKLNSNSSTDVNEQSCEQMVQSLLARLEKNESLLKDKTDAPQQIVTALNDSNSKKTISSHIALPLATRLLNITARFEHRIANILNRISKTRT